MRRMLALVVPLLALGLLQSTARADFFLSGTGGLNGGVGPQTITNGDKVFGNFSCSIVIDQVANPEDCSSIKVLTGSDSSGNLGIVFQAAFNAISTADFGAGSVDFLIGYTVTAPAPLITDIHMIFNGAITGTGHTNVTETVTAGGVVGQISVNNPPPVLESSADLTGGPYTSVSVSKDILLTSGPNGSAAMSFVGQYFSQVVPEPASFVLLGTLLTGVAFLRKRKA